MCPSTQQEVIPPAEEGSPETCYRTMDPEQLPGARGQGAVSVHGAEVRLGRGQSPGEGGGDAPTTLNVMNATEFSREKGH